MSATLYINREVSADGRTLTIEFMDGLHLSVTRDEALALLSVLEEQIPKMAVKI